MNQIGIDMFTRTTMFLDEEDVTLLLPFFEEDDVIVATKVSPRGSRSEPFFGTFVSDPRPTKAEGKEFVDQLWWPVTNPLVPHPFKSPIKYGVPFLAKLLIDIDPQDRYRD